MAKAREKEPEKKNCRNLAWQNLLQQMKTGAAMKAGAPVRLKARQTAAAHARDEKTGATMKADAQRGNGVLIHLCTKSGEIAASCKQPPLKTKRCMKQKNR